MQLPELAKICRYFPVVVDELHWGTTRRTSTYDRENRMTLQQVGAARTTYAYDGDGLRRRMVTSGGTTTFVWDGTDYLGEVK